MKAELETEFTIPVGDGAVVEAVIWHLPAPLHGSEHRYKYRLALIVDGVCVLRYDNELGKGDHKHLGNRQVPYDFRSPADLQVDFWTDVSEWMARR